MCYIPSGDAEVYRQSLQIQQSALASPEPSEEDPFGSEEKNREIGEETEEDLVERLVSEYKINSESIESGFVLKDFYFVSY